MRIYFIYFILSLKELSNSLNIQYIETSAKSSNRVEQVFQTMVNEIISDKQYLQSTNTNIPIVALEKPKRKTSSGFC